jgi:hypothetical protein
MTLNSSAREASHPGQDDVRGDAQGGAPDEVSGLRHAPAQAAAHRRYAAVTWGLAWLLLILAPWQLVWSSDRTWSQQPGLFSLVGIVGMLIFGGVECWHLARRTAHARGVSAAPELRLWWAALEYVAWFMAYVVLTPRLGYLPTTLLFALGLTWRLGYRRRRYLASAALVAVLTVLVFKAGLSVKVPAGAWYEALPEPLATFFLLNL